MDVKDIGSIKEELKTHISSPVLKKGGMNTLSEEFIPEKPVHRDRHILDLGKLIKELLELRITGTVFLEGPSGTGKTMCFMTVKKILDELIFSEKLDGVIVYVRGRGKTVNQVLSEALKNLSNQRKERFSFGEAITALEEISREKPVHVCIDEIDMVKSYSGGRNYSPSTVQDLLYYFSRTRNLSATIITNDFCFMDRLTDIRVRSSITKERTILFEKYSLQQLVDIFSYRVSLAFNDGAVPKEVIRKLSEIVHETTGDVRQGLEILRFAAILCAKEKKDVVDEEILRAAVELRNTQAMIDKIMALSDTHRVILASYYLCFRKSGKHEQTSQEIYDVYLDLIGRIGKKPLDQHSFRTKIWDLTTYGLLEQLRIGKGSRKGVERLYRLTIPIVTLNEAILMDGTIAEHVKSMAREIVEARVREARGSREKLEFTT